MNPDKSTEKPAFKVTGETDARRKKPYASPRLTTYGHISKLTTGPFGSKADQGAGQIETCI